jgi:UDP:flavonoid glycosyltransferase YjiC (YdhE family)
MGHLTRLLSMATRAGERIEPFFFSLSSAVPIVAKFGFAWEYCPSRDELDVPSSQWNPLFANRFAEVVRRFRPRALVFDGTWPYQGLGEAKEKFPDLLYVWSRRGMWHSGHRTDSLAKAPWFDLIIEPGEFAAEFDRGPTVGAAAHRVGPITLIDRDDLLSREQARAELGISQDEVAVLTNLGAGNFGDVRPHLDAIVEAVQRRPGWQIYTTRAAISRLADDHPSARVISVFPLARYLRAFDAGIVAAGYNTYHEALLAALPSIFVPQPKITDDQYARARYAEHVGAGLCVADVTVSAIEQALDRLADPAVADGIRSRCLELYPPNGAAAAIELVEQLLTRREVIA